MSVKSIKRTGYGRREHGQKAHFLDEFTVKGQFKAGRNMSISFLPNDDLLFEALVGDATGGGERGRAAVLLVRPAVRVQLNVNKELESMVRGTSIPNTAYCNHRFAYIRHYWNLKEPDQFQYSVFELSHGRAVTPTPGRRQVMNTVLVQGVDANSMRIFVPTVELTTLGDINVPLNFRADLTDCNIDFASGLPMNPDSYGVGDSRYNHLQKLPIYAIAITEIESVASNRAFLVDATDSINDPVGV